jgi:hypothetical protein
VRLREDVVLTGKMRRGAGARDAVRVAEDMMPTGEMR